MFISSPTGSASAAANSAPAQAGASEATARGAVLGYVYRRVWWPDVQQWGDGRHPEPAAQGGLGGS